VMWHAENTLVDVLTHTGKAARKCDGFDAGSLLLHPQQQSTLERASTLQAGYRVTAYSKIVRANLAETDRRASPQRRSLE